MNKENENEDFEVKIWTKGTTMNAQLSRQLNAMEVSSLITNFLLLLDENERIEVLKISLENIEEMENNNEKRKIQ